MLRMNESLFKDEES